MPEVSLSKQMPTSQARTWEVVSNPSRFAEWNLLHSRWVEGPPDVLEVGATMVEVVTIKGMPDTITFMAETVDEPRLVRLTGTGTVGSTVELSFAVDPCDDGTSQVTLDLSFTSSLLFGPVGRLIERAFRQKLKESLEKLAGLVLVDLR